MKTELIVILALAAALAFHRSPRGSGCGPAGCLILPVEFQQPPDFLKTSAAPPAEALTAANPGTLR